MKRRKKENPVGTKVQHLGIAKKTDDKAEGPETRDSGIVPVKRARKPPVGDSVGREDETDESAVSPTAVVPQPRRPLGQIRRRQPSLMQVK